MFPIFGVLIVPLIFINVRIAFRAAFERQRDPLRRDTLGKTFSLPEDEIVRCRHRTNTHPLSLWLGL